VSQDWIGADPTSLPCSFYGYSRRATEELFKRVALEYGALAREHRKLTTAEGDVSPALPPSGHSSDEAARSLLAAAHRSVRELRVSARAECEQALKKAKGRAAEIEQEARHAAGAAGAVLDAAAALRATLNEALRKLESSEGVAGAASARTAEFDGEPDGASSEPIATEPTTSGDEPVPPN
jgi:cell division septum initiation protein DivIVA